MYESSQPEVEINDCSAALLSELLQFVSAIESIFPPKCSFVFIMKIYTDSLKFEDPNVAVELLMISDSFFLENLKRLCEICVRAGIELEGKVDGKVAEQTINAFQVAKFHNARALKSFVLDFIVKNYKALKKSKHWNDL